MRGHGDHEHEHDPRDVKPVLVIAPVPRLLTADELAERWQVPKSWIYSATRDRRIPAVRLGRYYRYRVADVEAFEAAGGVGVEE